jgi:hypothetical protein
MALNNNNSLNYFGHLRDTLGEQIGNVYKNFARDNRKLALSISRKEYLVKCRKEFIIPRHIARSVKCSLLILSDSTPFRTKIDNMMQNFLRQLLNIEIKIVNWKIENQKKELDDLYQVIITYSPVQIFESFLNVQQKELEKKLNARRENTMKKLREQSNEKLLVQEKWLINLTPYQFPPEMKKLLSLGPKFSLPGSLKKKDVFELIADTEQILEDIDENVKDDVRGKIVNAIMNEMRRHKTHNPSVIKAELEKMEKVTKAFFDSNQERMKEICIIPADKGNSTVILSKSKYKDGILALVNDTNTYQEIARDPTLKYEKEFNEEIKKLERNKIISENKRKQLTRYDSICPRIYGLAKVHKLPNPIPPNATIKLRPIVSCQQSPAYNMSRFLCEILNRSIKQETYNIKNSHAFRDFILKMTLPTGYEFISLDVVSLFSCIPWERVEDAVEKNWPNIELNTGLCRQEFTRLLKLMMERSYFQFEKKFYKQIDGTAMGSPASPAIADLVMTTLLDTIMPSLEGKVLFVRKYVDDLILAVQSEEVENVLNIFNEYHHAIQFTIEREVNGRIPFLDMLLVRKEDGKVETEFYVKPLASGRILNFNSCHPMHLKMNVAENMVRRMFDLTSSDTKPIQRAREFLKKNGFPLLIINRLINEYHKKKSPNAIDQQECFKSMRYVEGLSEKIKKIVKNENQKINIAFKARNKIQSFFTNTKDAIEPMKKSKVIYGLKCNMCAEQWYVGQTRQRLMARMSGHKSNLKCALEELKTKPINYENVKSVAKGNALVYHAIMKRHEFNFDAPTILHTTNHSRKLNVLEMLHIQDKATVNLRTDCEGLNMVYRSLLERWKRKNHLEF